MQDLTGKVAVITGAGSGIGRALASRLSAEGMRVVLADIDEDGLDRTVALLVASGTSPDDVLTQLTDVRLEASVDALAERAFGQWDRVDVLVNNAGVVVGGLLWERSAADLEFVLGVNLWGILHGIHAFVPRMLAQGGDGHIVNTCSSASLLNSTFGGPYNISKFAALSASECLALDLAAVGSALKVTALCPGYVRTELAATSERTRPADLVSPPTPDSSFVMQVLAEEISAGIAPAEVADLALAAIRSEQFLVVTHDHHRADIAARAERLATGQLPDSGSYS